MVIVPRYYWWSLLWCSLFSSYCFIYSILWICAFCTFPAAGTIYLSVIRSPVIRVVKLWYKAAKTCLHPNSYLHTVTQVLEISRRERISFRETTGNTSDTPFTLNFFWHTYLWYRSFLRLWSHFGGACLHTPACSRTQNVVLHRKHTECISS